MTTLSRLPCAACGAETIHHYGICIHHGVRRVIPPVTLDARTERKRLKRIERAQRLAGTLRERSLTAREQRVVDLFVAHHAEPFVITKIATALDCYCGTVTTSLKRASEKAGLGSRAGLVEWARGKV